MDSQLFRNAMGKFATGITVLTTLYEEEPHGMTANAFMSVSLDPKLVVISIGHKAKFLNKVKNTKKFAVNILADDQEHYSRIFAGQQQGEGAFDTLANLPVLKGALAQVACEVVSEYVEGDHTLFIGKVLDIRIEEKEPILFYGGKYRKLANLERIEN
ncbi:flavin reductase family protein [Bacillus massiliigorillae]|uniref:flavin reductase family protein n=1 Tax=Bacillus massiliigorillae TaxID=1243664 RepID=UPI0003A7F02C|nr:flavin reductase family protein [Bacillus massiliigorillae]